MRTVCVATPITQLAEKNYTTKISMDKCLYFFFVVFAGTSNNIATRTSVCIPGDVFKQGYYHDCSWVNSQNKEAWVGVQYTSTTSVKVKAGGSDLMTANSYSFCIHGIYKVTEAP